MSLNDKLIIPLINDNITASDISTEAGFVNIFYTDVNRPYLDNNIFLLYLNDVDTKESSDRMSKFITFDNLYARYFIKIKGVSLTLYVFTINNIAIKKLKCNSRMFTKKDILRILSFWNFKDEDINDFTINQSNVSTFQPFCNKSVPEEDYIPELKPVYNEKSRAFHFERSA